jgi:lipase
MGSDFRPVTLIHGLIGTLADPAIAAVLAPCPVLAPDLIGYGALASAPPEDITLDAQVEHVRAAVLDAFGAKRVHVVGHSVGGVVAMLLARRHPDLVASVTSVEGNFTLKDAFWSGKVAAMSPREAEDMMDGFRADPGGWLDRAGRTTCPLSKACSARRRSISWRASARGPDGTCRTGRSRARRA